MPESKRQAYVECLLDQARSSSFHGAPAAIKALELLPDDVAQAGIDGLDGATLCWGQLAGAKALIKGHPRLAQSELHRDIAQLAADEFKSKYGLW